MSPAPAPSHGPGLANRLAQIHFFGFVSTKRSLRAHAPSRLVSDFSILFLSSLSASSYAAFTSCSFILLLLVLLLSSSLSSPPLSLSPPNKQQQPSQIAHTEPNSTQQDKRLTTTLIALTSFIMSGPGLFAPSRQAISLLRRSIVSTQSHSRTIVAYTTVHPVRHYSASALAPRQDTHADTPPFPAQPLSAATLSQTSIKNRVQVQAWSTYVVRLSCWYWKPSF